MDITLEMSVTFIILVYNNLPCWAVQWELWADWVWAAAEVVPVAADWVQAVLGAGLAAADWEQLVAVASRAGLLL